MRGGHGGDVQSKNLCVCMSVGEDTLLKLGWSWTFVHPKILLSKQYLLYGEASASLQAYCFGLFIHYYCNTTLWF